MEIEPEMLAMETVVPVYFAVEDEALLSIYEQTQAASASQGSASAAEGEPSLQSAWGSCVLHLPAFPWLLCLQFPPQLWPQTQTQVTPPLLSPVLLHTATANGFQMVTSGAQSQAVSDWLITSVEVSPHLLSSLQGLCTGRSTLIPDI